MKTRLASIENKNSILRKEVIGANEKLKKIAHAHRVEAGYQTWQGEAIPSLNSVLRIEASKQKKRFIMVMFYEGAPEEENINEKIYKLLKFNSELMEIGKPKDISIMAVGCTSIDILRKMVEVTQQKTKLPTSILLE